MAEYSDRTVDLENGTLECPAPIKDLLEVTGGDVIVLMETSEEQKKYDTEIRCRNVWRITQDGSVRWKIRKADMISGYYPRYASIWVEDGNLWAYATSGSAYQVDLATGKLGEIKQMR